MIDPNEYGTWQERILSNKPKQTNGDRNIMNEKKLQVMDIGADLQRAYDEGYARGWKESEWYILHCGDTDEPETNGDRIRAMTDEELIDRLSLLVCVHLFDDKVMCEGDGCRKCWSKWLKQESNL